MNRRACLALLLLAGCTSASTSQPPVATTPARTTSTPPPIAAADTFVRRCRTEVAGTLGPHVLRHSANAGPLSLAYAKDLANVPRSEFSRSGRVFSVKLLVLARARVTLFVDASDRRHASLSYDPAHFNVPRLSVGDAVVTFVACRHHERLGTQFNGAMLIDKLRCFGFEVAWAGGHRHLEVSFGAGRCPAA